RRDTRSDVIEVRPRGPEQRDLAFALRLGHQILLWPGRPAREAVVIRHADAFDALDDAQLARRAELLGESGEHCHLRVAGSVGLQHPEGIFLGLAAAVPAGPVERARDRPLLLAPLD